MGGKGPMLCVRNDQTDDPWHITQLSDQLVTISAQLHAALVTGKDRPRSTQKTRDNFHSLLTLFSPRSKQKAAILADEPAEIDLLIATDCISEGQNLQDCDYLINYDIHWNPVRIIQRFGRIDRIGSQKVASPLRRLNEEMDVHRT